MGAQGKEIDPDELAKRIDRLQLSIERNAEKLLVRVTRNRESLTPKERKELARKRQKIIHEALRNDLPGKRGGWVRLTEAQYREALSAINNALAWRYEELERRDYWCDRYWRERRQLEQRLHNLDKRLRASWVVRAIWKNRPLPESVQFFTFGEARCPHRRKRKECVQKAQQEPCLLPHPDGDCTHYCTPLGWHPLPQRVRDEEPSMDRPAHRPREYWVNVLLLGLGMVFTDAGMSQADASKLIGAILSSCFGSKRETRSLLKRLRLLRRKERHRKKRGKTHKVPLRLS